MKLLVVSNLYPPQHLGGFELITKDVVDSLRNRGDKVTVLTSTFGGEVNKAEEDVLRWLPSSFQKHKCGSNNPLYQFWQQKALRGAVEKAFRYASPDLILVTGLVGIPALILYWLRKSHIPLCCSIFDEWLLEVQDTDRWLRFWRYYSPNRVKEYLKLVGRWGADMAGYPSKIAIEVDGVWFGSHFLSRVFSNAPIKYSESIILYPTIPGDLLRIPSNDHEPGEPLRLLYIGRICREKGVDTVIRAMGILRDRSFCPMPTLSIAGRLVGSQYEQQLMNLIQIYELQDRVHFLGLVAREDIYRLYENHSVVVFATQIEEPFGMVPLEAMASGRAVIATASGGAKEYLEKGKNALIFAAGDAEMLASHIEILARNKAIVRSLVDCGRITARSFTHKEQMIDQLSTFFTRIKSLGSQQLPSNAYWT